MDVDALEWASVKQYPLICSASNQPECCRVSILPKFMTKDGILRVATVNEQSIITAQLHQLPQLQVSPRRKE